MANQPTFADLKAEVARLKLELEMRKHTIFEIRDAAKRGYEAGYADAYKAGAIDALNPVSPDHARALACRAP